jgi:hypothetical protein
MTQGAKPSSVPLACLPLLERLKASQEEIAKLKLLLEVNGEEKVLSESATNTEEGAREEQVIEEAEREGKEGEEIQENER